jgi:hypothetical protein
MKCEATALPNMILVVLELRAIVSGHLMVPTRMVRDELQKGKTLAEMQEDNILEDWKDWGTHVSCDMWIETIVRSLDADKKG